MASTISIYTHTPKIITDGTVLLESDNIIATLCTSSYIYSAAHTQFSSASGAELSDSTYEAQTLTGVSVANSGIDASGATFRLLFSATFRQVIVYANVTRNGLTDPLLWRYLLDDTPADVSINNAEYVLQFNASGLITYTIS